MPTPGERPPSALRLEIRGARLGLAVGGDHRTIARLTFQAGGDQLPAAEYAKAVSRSTSSRVSVAEFTAWFTAWFTPASQGVTETTFARELPPATVITVWRVTGMPYAARKTAITPSLMLVMLMASQASPEQRLQRLETETEDDVLGIDGSERVEERPEPCFEADPHDVQEHEHDGGTAEHDSDPHNPPQDGGDSLAETSRCTGGG